MKKFVMALLGGICLFCSVAPMPVYAAKNTGVISDREIVESLTRLEEGVKTNKEMIGSLRTEMGSLRTEIGSLRTEIGSLRSEMNLLRSELLSFMKWGFGLLLSGMFILVGFILWDRRSALKPVKDELESLERQKVDRLITAMKKLSVDDSHLADVLRNVGLL